MNEADGWKPGASPDTLRTRAAMLSKARAFFARREVMEVETPLACGHGVTDPNIENISADFGASRLWLRSSPEYHMKRLLAAGSGDIYQIGKVFRRDECGSRHEPEFTMIEWYRQGLQLAGMIDECCELIIELGRLGREPASGYQCISYQDAFLRHCGVDPFSVGAAELHDAFLAHQGANADTQLAASIGDDRLAWLDWHASQRVHPELSGDGLWVVHSYPAEQAMLARRRPDAPHIAERFEVFFRGVELANGYRELTDPEEQAQRFATDRLRRKSSNRPDMAPDPWLLGAMRAGLPECSGVAVGLERILMTTDAHTEISATMAFTAGN